LGGGGCYASDSISVVLEDGVRLLENTAGVSREEIVSPFYPGKNSSVIRSW